MASNDTGPDDFGPTVDSRLDKALSDLLEQTRHEPVSDRLRDLARQLEAALQQARQQRGVDKG